MSYKNWYLGTSGLEIVVSSIGVIYGLFKYFGEMSERKLCEINLGAPIYYFMLTLALILIILKIGFLFYRDNSGSNLFERLQKIKTVLVNANTFAITATILQICVLVILLFNVWRSYAFRGICYRTVSGTATAILFLILNAFIGVGEIVSLLDPGIYNLI